MGSRAERLAATLPRTGDTAAKCRLGTRWQDAAGIDAGKGKVRGRGGGVSVRRRWPIAACVLAGLVLLCLFYGKASWRLAGDSDNATVLLEGLSLLHGNLILHGWRLPQDVNWTIDAPAYALVSLLRGVNPADLHDAPALLMALAVGAAMWAAVDAARDWAAGIIGGGVAFAAVGLPTMHAVIPMPYYWLQSPMHVGTAAFALAGLVLLARGVSAWDAARWQAWVGGVLLALASANDPLELVVAMFPATALWAITSVRHREDAQTWGRLAAFAVGAGVAGRLAVMATHALGGMDAPGLSAFTEAWATLGLQGAKVLHGLLQMWGANLFGINLATKQGIAATWHLLVLVALVWIVAAQVKRWWNGPADLLDTLLASGFAFDVAAYFVYASNPADASTVRYLVPSTVFGAALLGRWAARQWAAAEAASTRRWLAGGAAVTLASSAVLFAPWTKLPAVVPAQMPVVNFLEAHGLRHGLGEYWDSSIITLASGGKVMVRPVGPLPGGKVAPIEPMSQASWYSGSANFVVWGGDAPNAADLATDERLLAAAFGAPQHVYTVGIYRVGVWGENLIPKVDVTASASSQPWFGYGIG